MKQAHVSATCMHVHVGAPTHPRQLSQRHLLPVVHFVTAETTHDRGCRNHAGTLRGAHFVSDVDLAEAEGAEVGAGLLHRRLDRLMEEFLHKLADVGPHLFHCLRGIQEEKAEF